MTKPAWRPLNVNAISKFRPNEFLLDWRERVSTVYDEENGYTVGQGWGAITKLWEAMRMAKSYQEQLTIAMRIQKIERKMGIAVRPFEDLGLNVEEGELDAEMPHTEEELVVLADTVNVEDDDKKKEVLEDEDSEDPENPYSEAALAASYNAREEGRRACVVEIHHDRDDRKKKETEEREEKRKYCSYELK